MDKQALEIMALAIPAVYSVGQSGRYGTLDEQIEFNTSGATAMYNPGSHMAGCTCPLCASSFADRSSRDTPGQFVTGSYHLVGEHSLQERVDASDVANLHLNYDITNIKKKRSLEILGEYEHFKCL